MGELDDLLIHESGAFSKEELSRRAKKYEFSQPQILEVFAWDYELTTQLQELSGNFILKGGAIAQLYLQPDLQRGSIDIDLITTLSEDEIEQIMNMLLQKFRRSSFFRIKKYSPKNPIANIPLCTYHVFLPSVFKESCHVKVDILTSLLALPTVELSDVETFALKVSKIEGLSLGALIGDKLLTLAMKTVGMKHEADYPKQIYDIEMLAFKRGDLTTNEIKHMAKAIKQLVAEEAQFRGITTSPKAVLEDVVKTMEHFSQIDLTSDNASIKRNIINFQQLYVSKREMSTSLYKWSSRALRIKFLATLMQSYLSNKINDRQVILALLKGKEISFRLTKADRSVIPTLRKQLLAFAKTNIPYFKGLKGKPLERIFWQIITPTKLDIIAKLVEK